MPTIGFSNRTYQDYDGEKSVAKFYVEEYDATNYTAQSTAVTAVWTAVAAITKGGLVTWQQGNRYTDPNPVLPSDDTSQRELKWLVQYHDSTTGKKYSMELPCADTAALDPGDRAHAYIGDADVVDAFITAFEAVAVSEVGNAVVVDEITLVGRRI